MRIAFLCYYPLNVFPAGLVEYDTNKIFQPAPWIVNLSNALAELNNIELHIVTDSSWISENFNFKFNNINFHIIRNPYSIPFMKRGLPSWLPINVLTKYHLIYKKYAAMISEIKPDIIHSHGTEFHYSYIASKLNYPYLISLQGLINYLKDYLTTWNSLFLKIQCRIEKEVIKKTANIISRAKFSDEFIYSVNPTANVIRIDDIVDYIFTIDYEKSGIDSIFFAGNIVASKGVEDLLSAFQIIKPEYTNTKLRLAGAYDINYFNFLKKKYHKLDFENEVLFLGQLNREEILKEYQNCRLFVFPSHFETSPNVIMEAMSLGVPIISTKTGGIPDMIIDGFTGILVNIKHPEEIAKSIMYLYKNNKLAENFGERARAEAQKKFNKYPVSRETLKNYEQILSEQNKNE